MVCYMENLDSKSKLSFSFWVEKTLTIAFFCFAFHKFCINWFSQFIRMGQTTWIAIADSSPFSKVLWYWVHHRQTWAAWGLLSLKDKMFVCLFFFFQFDFKNNKAPNCGLDSKVQRPQNCKTLKTKKS